MFDLSMDKLAKEINELKPKRVLLQLPEGIKHKIQGMADDLKEKTQAEYIILVDPNWGSCDLADEKALALGCDLLIHFGHNKMYEGKIKTIYYPIPVIFDSKPVIKKLINLLKKEKISEIGLVGTSQFLPYFDEIKKSLKENKIEVLIGKGTARVNEMAQVLGCNYSAVHSISDKAEAIVFFGDGIFHPIGIAFSSTKRIFSVNPLTEEINELTKEKELFLKKRFAAIALAMKAQKFGVITSIKKGQNFAGRIRQVKELIESKNRKAYILASDFVYADYYKGLDIDCFVNAACPRISLEDSSTFDKPIINPNELEIALGKRKFEDYKFDEY